MYVISVTFFESNSRAEKFRKAARSVNVDIRVNFFHHAGPTFNT
jgi:hypothetical protein